MNTRFVNKNGQQRCRPCPERKWDNYEKWEHEDREDKRWESEEKEKWEKWDKEKCRIDDTIEFCQTITLDQSFCADEICEKNVKIAYDTEFLGFTVEESNMKADLPCGICCDVKVQKITLAGAIPYIVCVGPVSSRCGDCVDVCATGCATADQFIGYVCHGKKLDLDPISCCNVKVEDIDVKLHKCGESKNTNVQISGKFKLVGLFNCMK